MIPDRFQKMQSNLDILMRAYTQDLENEFVVYGINGFFRTHYELSWRLLGELLEYEGRIEATSGSPREILKTAYAVFDFLDEDVWLSMMRMRNSMTHIYDGEEARRLVDRILAEYIPAFIRLREGIEKRYPELPEEI